MRIRHLCYCRELISLPQTHQFIYIVFSVLLMSVLYMNNCLLLYNKTFMDSAFFFPNFEFLKTSNLLATRGFKRRIARAGIEPGFRNLSKLNSALYH